MLLSDTILVKCKCNNKLSFYKEMGYDTSLDFLVDVKHLLPSSTYIIEENFRKKKGGNFK